MARRWVGRMWFLLVCNGLASSVDGRLQSAGMFKNEYWFRVVSVPGMHETSGFRHRSRCQDPNPMAAAVRPESHGSCSQMKAYCSDRIWERRKGQHHRRWEDQCWLNTPCIWARFIANIEQRSLSSERIYWCDWHIIAELQHLCSRAHLLARFRRLVQSEYRFFRYFTDAWNIYQQDDFIFRNVYSLFQ